MNSNNDRFRDFLGVPPWHDLGYKGKRGLTVTGENPNFSVNGHAYCTEDIFHEIAPDRKIVYYGGELDQFAIGDGFKTTMAKIADNNADTMYMSFTGDGDNYDEYSNPVMPFCSIFVAAGNSDSSDYTKMMDCNNIFGVGAYFLMYPDNEIRPAYFSSEANTVDFSAPTYLTVQYPIGVEESFSGTSCAAPVLCGMAALVNDFFIDKTGKPLSSAMMYQFFYDNAHDFYYEGKDVKTGWGYVTLPSPDTIDIAKYQSTYITEDNDMTGEEIYNKLNEYLVDLSAPDWAKKELQEAVDMGITDGTRPMQLIPRYQAAIMCKRAVEKAKQ